MPLSHYDLPSLGSSEKLDVNVEYKTGASFSGTVENRQRVGFGIFVWPNGARYEGEFSQDKRFGKGKQDWPDGSSYEGDFVDDLRHGNGKHCWANGEVYEGQFFKDRRHGTGVYRWPDNSHFTGHFFMDKREGYGVYVTGSQDTFEGLYKDDDREGPGVMTYRDGSQDVGLWHGEKLIKLCSSVVPATNINDFPEFDFDPATNDLFIEMIETPRKDRLIEELKPPSELDYTPVDFHRDNSSLFNEELDRQSQAADESSFHEEFFQNVRNSAKSRSKAGSVKERASSKGSKPASRQSSASSTRSKRQSKSAGIYVEDKNGRVKVWNRTPRLIEIQRHMYKHREAESSAQFSVAAVVACDRSSFSEPGPLEKASTRLIEAAASGDVETVESLLIGGRVHVDVTDKDGNTPLIFAATNWHQEVMNCLLDNAADIDQLNNQGLNTLAACVMLFYPKDLLFPPGTPDPIERTATPRPDDSKTASQTSLKTKVTGKRSGETTQKPESDSDDSESLASMDEFYSHRSIRNLTIQVTDRLRDRGATQLSMNEAVVTSFPEGEGDVRQLAFEKHRHERMQQTISLILRRGADPNASSVPMPPLFFAIKCADADMVQELLLKGAHTEATLPKGGLRPLHLAVATPGAEGVMITRLLLDALASPDSRATADDSYLYKDSEEEWRRDSIDPASEAILGGRTPLHIACNRDDNYKFAAAVVSLLLEHHADPNLLCNGHSPLSLAVASGNDSAVSQLLSCGAEPSLHLTHGVGSALCVAASTAYEHRRSPAERIALIDSLMKSGANILAPILIGPKRLTGSAVDYAYHVFNLDRRIAHMPYHALTPDERETYAARRDMLAHLGHLFRQQAVEFEIRQRANDPRVYRSPTPYFVYTGTGNQLPPEAARKRAIKSGQQVSFQTAGGDGSPAQTKSSRNLDTDVRKPLIRYCYECGRQVGVRLSPCSRCKEVLYCSKVCKLKAWNSRHKEECVRIGRAGQGRSPSPGGRNQSPRGEDSKVPVRGLSRSAGKAGMTSYNGRIISLGGGNGANPYAQTEMGKHPTAMDNYSYE